MHLTCRDFLIRLVLTPGVSRKVALICWRWVQDHQMTSLTDPGLADLLAHGALTARQQQAIQLGLFSDQVTKQFALNTSRSQCLTLADAAYPVALREIYEPPVVLFYLGNLAHLSAPQLGVVGTRHPSDYAFRAMQAVLPTVVQCGVTIVSGMAQGVDTLAHQVALAHHGTTIAVVGTGLGRCYPAANRPLMAQLTRQQLVVSEYPWAAGPAKFHFVERNRVISGLSQSLLVVEAARRSGSLITANFALQENRNVLAIPGAIDVPNSVGTNELILAGAKPILNSEHIMEELLVDKRP
ncbi:DNA-processing protein DprA [Levilactobacillus namurensis]|uniref:DNA-processing protein DprA n=1 Tax=Levilactobacillus namurensis TaxID=380393 RepID=UPI00046349C0|nr:DNA-processing protein DprA [Levilactobacillus namurensis]